MQKEINDMFNIKDKIIIITGAAGLLGKEHAEVVAACGGIPVLLDISKEAVKNYASLISEKYEINCSGYSVDITNEEAVKNCSLEVLKVYGRVDGLINNAANNPKIESNDSENFSRLENFRLKNWNQDISVGLTGAFLCSKYFGYEISKNSNGGTIINVSSDLGLIAPDQRLYRDPSKRNDEQDCKPVTYSVVKSGIIGLTRYLSTYWVNENVRCNAICPGGVENGQSEEFIKKISEKIPLGRMAKPDEYRSTLIWMLSDSSSYLNGAIISVDGGRTAW